MYYLTVPDPYDYGHLVIMRIERRLGFSFPQFPYEVLIQKAEVTRWIGFTSFLKRGQ